MKTEHPGITVSVEAAQDLSKHLCVRPNGYLGENTGYALGVCAADTDSGEMAPVVISGIVLVETYGEVAIGNMVVCSDDGQVYDSELSSTSAIYLEYIGVALDAATDTGDLIRVKLF